MKQSIHNISPIDGRYHKKTNNLKKYFSEAALIKYRVHVEIKYFIKLINSRIIPSRGISQKNISEILKIATDIKDNDFLEIKRIEKKTNHDVKAVEYFIKKKFDKIGLQKYKEFVHFGLTSQDINNTSFPLMLKDALNFEYYPEIKKIQKKLDILSKKWIKIPMLAKTHGQPATPTTLGKELKVFTIRIKEQLKILKKIPHCGKFGGATGNMNAHFIAFPNSNWHNFAREFLKEIGLNRSYPTTQIEHYDNLAAQMDCLKRINTILIDLSRDMWMYISMNYFNQKINPEEIGSSAMPHKVNPIDFENAEGNLGLANSIFSHLANKLPISRLQRDLSDSTVMRNLGVPISHTMISINSLLKGLDKININKNVIFNDLNSDWAILAEAIQTILRREGLENPYEQLKQLTRNNTQIQKNDLLEFIDNLNISNKLKSELKQITPSNYVGKT